MNNDNEIFLAIQEIEVELELITKPSMPVVDRLKRIKAKCVELWELAYEDCECDECDECEDCEDCSSEIQEIEELQTNYAELERIINSIQDVFKGNNHMKINTLQVGEIIKRIADEIATSDVRGIRIEQKDGPNIDLVCLYEEYQKRFVIDKEGNSANPTTTNFAD